MILVYTAGPGVRLPMRGLMDSIVKEQISFEENKQNKC